MRDTLCAGITDTVLLLLKGYVCIFRIMAGNRELAISESFWAYFRWVIIYSALGIQWAHLYIAFDNALGIRCEI